MLNDQRALVIANTSNNNSHNNNNNNIETDHGDQYDDQNQDQRDDHIRDIHALTPPRQPPSTNINRNRRRETWETSSHRSSSLSSEGGAPSENFTTMSREFNALVIAGSSIPTTTNNNGTSHEAEGTSHNNLGRIFEEENMEENNPLAIVADNNNIHLDPSPSPRAHGTTSGTSESSNMSVNQLQGEVTVHRVKKEEVESKINAWQTAKIAKVNNRFKREDAVINGWENEEVQKATSWMKKVEVCTPDFSVYIICLLRFFSQPLKSLKYIQMVKNILCCMHFYINNTNIY
nr:remorin 4.2-like isoform X2 [Nicotiana tomentosiformis]